MWFYMVLYDFILLLYDFIWFLCVSIWSLNDFIQFYVTLFASYCKLLGLSACNVLALEPTWLRDEYALHSMTLLTLCPCTHEMNISTHFTFLILLIFPHYLQVPEINFDPTFFFSPPPLRAGADLCQQNGQGKCTDSKNIYLHRLKIHAKYVHGKT